MMVIVIDARGGTVGKGALRLAKTTAPALILMGAVMADPADAYTKGEIGRKAEPIIQVLKDVARPVAYGCYIWAGLKYMLGNRADALVMARAVTWAYVGVQVIPWIMDIIDSIGEA